MHETVDVWIKRRMKQHKPPKTYLQIFNRGGYKSPNYINFTIQENTGDEELKEEQDDEMIMDNRSNKNKRRMTKASRGYSLYVQKEKHQKSLQDRELERLIVKDIQSKEAVTEELGESCKILELMKFIFMLKESNFKNLFDSSTSSTASYSKFRLNQTVINKQKYKNILVNRKMDSLIRKYLLTKHHSDFISKKDEALVELVQHFPMMYEFKTRILFFKLTAFSSLRNKYYASELFTRALTRDEGGITISRRRLEIPRECILDDALNKVKDIQEDDSFLEFQFENEVGTGLGPTLEYYALIGKAIKEEPDMWKETTDNSLYPNPLNLKKRTSKEKKKIEKFFELVGTITARSLMDERLIDLPISVVFWKLVFSETAILDDVEKFDKNLYKGLKLIQDLVDKSEKQSKDLVLPRHIKEGYIKGDEDTEYMMSQKSSLINTEWDCDYEKPTKSDINVEDLCLTFTLPGIENIDLVRNGHKKIVSENNMKEYLRLTLNSLFNDSIKLQVNAFRRGINNVFRMDALKCFLFEELEGLISGEDTHGNKGIQKWNKKILLENVVPDHGYDRDSPAFLNFIEYMEGLGKEKLRDFLMFITGSPRLPLGGLKSLKPKLTVVKRT